MNNGRDNLYVHPGKRFMGPCMYARKQRTCVYGHAGRRFEPASVRSLYKVCNSQMCLSTANRAMYTEYHRPGPGGRRVARRAGRRRAQHACVASMASGPLGALFKGNQRSFATYITHGVRILKGMFQNALYEECSARNVAIWAAAPLRSCQRNARALAGAMKRLLALGTGVGIVLKPQIRQKVRRVVLAADMCHQ